MKKYHLLFTLIPMLCACDKMFEQGIQMFCGSETESSSTICMDADKNLINGFGIEYYDNNSKQKKLSGNFRNGLADGIIRWYYENGKLNGKATYTNGNPDGSAKSYYPNGKLQQKANYTDGKLDGISRAYYENGKLNEEAHYKNGKLDGVSKSYYENGKLNKEAHYKNGKLDGVLKAYYENGNLQQESNYKDEKLDGVVKEYYENGNLRLESNYKDDEPNGILKSYYVNGNLHIEGNTKDGKADGITRVYYENGLLNLESLYQDNKVISETETVYDENNKVLYTTTTENGKNTSIIFRGEKVTKAQLDNKLKSYKYDTCIKKANICGDNPTKGCRAILSGNVFSFGRGGVLISHRSCAWCESDVFFLETYKDFVSDERISSKNYYQYTGIYQYQTMLGETRRVRSYRETDIPVCTK